MRYDQTSFILGMITAFCECAAGGCKRMALSPPLSPAECAAVMDAARDIIARHGLVFHHETNPELPENARFEWIVIARRPETLDEYRRRRAAGLSPAQGLSPFSDLLSYDPAEAVSTGYDAYREFFGDPV